MIDIKKFFNDVLKMELPTADDIKATQAKKNRIQAVAKSNVEASRKAEAESMEVIKAMTDDYNKCKI